MANLGARSTAEEALRGISLRGKTALVTGASSGLGIETSRVLALAGANVVMAARNTAAAEEVARSLREALPRGAGILSVRALDLADLGSIHAFAKAYRARGEPLHLLVNNAGVMATPRGTTAQGHELQLGTNHLGHFALTMALEPVLRASAPGRVVTVSSGLHVRGSTERMMETLRSDPSYQKRKYVPFDAYGDSKLANILFARELANRLGPAIVAFSLHPGVIPTPLSRNLGVGGWLFRVFGRPFMKSVPQGAATTIFGATAPELEGRSGEYLSDCAIARSSSDGRDSEAARVLWKESERLVASTA
ncbi:MAG: SDR family oxidoreductase [Polyangiaceae bacterium]|nr:SDR family oxidoreductase [Polyangiaceae bacterium]